MFNVTIRTRRLRLGPTVTDGASSGRQDKYPTVDQYLSLVRTATMPSELINTSKVDEPTASCSSAVWPNLPDFYNTLSKSARDLSDASRQKSGWRMFGRTNIKERQTCRSAAICRVSRTRWLLDLGLDQIATPAAQFRDERQRLPPPDGTWYPQSEQPENDLLNDYHHAEYAQIFDAKNRSDEWYTP
ncbi:MAG: hypothetical protein ACLT4C_04200 [Butyricicoccus sp.]